jgi:ATP-binding cassette, subfamily F, member 3
VLLEAIASFSGTVIFVSHDRYFIDRLATRVLEVENGSVISHEGNYEDYLRRKGLAVQATAPAAPFVPVDAAVIEPGSVAEYRAEPAKEKTRRLNPIKQKQMEERCAFLEEEVPRVEASLAHTEEQLGVFVSAQETQRLTVLAEDLRGQLASLTGEWEELMLQLEEQSA